MPGPATHSPAPAATLTFLFTDIEGSTERWEHQHDAMAAALVRHDELLRTAIEGRGGHVFKTVGDAFYAAFADAAAGLAAALDAWRAVVAEDWQAFGPDFADVRVRMGLHAGRAEARGGDYFGPALNRTARLTSAGHGGQVLLSHRVRQDLGDALPAGLTLRDLGEHRLKDLRHAERIWQVMAGGLPDVTLPLTTAGELGARDRIVVVDPTAADREGDDEPTVVTRTVGETLAALRQVILRDAPTVTLTTDQVREAAAHRPADLSEYRLGRVAEWSQPRYRLDGRFVAMTLLVDQGEEAVSGRWAAKEERYNDLGKLLAAVAEPAVVVLGPPGSGKSTLLRHLELDAAIAGLRAGEKKGKRSEEGGSGDAGASRVSFFIQLNGFKPLEPDQPPPSPERWLASRWSAAYPDLPPLGDLLAQGRMVLLLDALNEMPAASEREFRERVGLWQDWLVRLTREQPGNRIVFSCRTLDYSAPLSTPALRVPQVQVEPLSDAQVRDFVRLYSPARGEEIWAAIRGKQQLDALRSPLFLALLVDQVEGTGDLAADRAGLFTGFVRQALRREVERKNPLFALEELLASRDVRRLAQWQWRDAYELPERGALVPKLSALAYGMQEAEADGGASQVRVDYDRALELVDHPEDETIVKAGLAISVLDENPAADEVLYRHQLVQEYFAARVLARWPRPELVEAPWRSADIRPTVADILATLPAGETLPPLPQTGWEETTLLAATMAPDAEAFVRGVMGANLALAGRCAAQARVSERLSAAVLDGFRWALVHRSRDPEADLRDRIACGLAVGELGDPRWERREGPHGAYLVPPLVEIPGGRYPIGEDEPIQWLYRGMGQVRTETAHMPRRQIEVSPFQIGRFPVTNAEWRCFMVAGGYEEERWWETEDARAWRRGELTDEGARANGRIWRRIYQGDPDLLEQMVEDGRLSRDEEVERWREWMLLDDAAFEAAVGARWQAQQTAAPEFWQDERFNGASQPVVGICWFEARAYLTWLAAQTGQAFRLPTEVEWEAAARGVAGRAYAYDDRFGAIQGNTLATRLRSTTPVGVFVEGDTPEGVSDMAGNVRQWTSSAWDGDVEQDPRYAFAYRSSDGHAQRAGPFWMYRGGAWQADPAATRAALRKASPAPLRSDSLGFRCVLASPISEKH